MEKSEGSSFSIWKIVLPTFIGLAVIVYMFLDEFKLSDLDNIHLTWHSALWIGVALLFMIGRDAGFTIRYRYLTEKKLSWKQAIKVTLLAEFGSAVTPSSVGGSSMAVLFLAKEGIPVGRSTAMVFCTTLLDELFFVTFFPILLIFLPIDQIFGTSALGTGVYMLFVAAYIIKLLLAAFLIIGLFFKPQFVAWVLLKFFSLPFFRRWRNGAIKAGEDMIVASHEIRGKRFSFWQPLIIATILSWTSRFLVVNALFMAFFTVDNNLLVFARQFVMWVLMIISPTPGASGVSEVVFKGYLGEFIPYFGIIPVITLLWRLLTYYNYLFIGALIVPKWIKKSFSKNEQ